MKSLLILFLFIGCARQQTLALREHGFNKEPRVVLWFQIPGLHEEHLALLKMSSANKESENAFEVMSCFGQLWSYNLYDLRPSAFESYASQMSASKNVKRECGELPQGELWSHFGERGYKMGYYELGATPEQSMDWVHSCGQEAESWKQGHHWLSKKVPGQQKDVEFFHFQDTQDLGAPGLRYDQTCQGKTCFADFKSNVTTFWNRLSREHSRVILVVRNYSYLNALLAKDILRAREILNEIETVISSFLFDTTLTKDRLILLTGAQTTHFEFPKQGRTWADFEKSGRHIIFRHSSLLSPVMAWGARAENFCGIYEEYEVLGRLLFTPQKEGFGATLKRVF